MDATAGDTKKIDQNAFADLRMAYQTISKLDTLESITNAGHQKAEEEIFEKVIKKVTEVAQIEESQKAPLVVNKEEVGPAHHAAPAPAKAPVAKAAPVAAPAAPVEAPAA